MPASDARISPTAHYTSWVWYANGLSHPALTSALGRALYLGLAPANAAYRWLWQAPDLEATLLARHRGIDALLARAIEDGRVRQVVEIAAGMSPRGYRFAARYRDLGLRYLEGDLAEMAAHKRAALARAGLLGPNHQVVHLDAGVDHGDESLEAVTADRLDPGLGTAIVTEGLTGYFGRPALEAMWRRFAAFLSRFLNGVYLTDLHVGGEASGAAVRAFALVLSALVRGRVHLHFGGEAEAETALHRAGFASAEVHVPSAGGRRPPVRIAEARSAPTL